MRRLRMRRAGHGRTPPSFAELLDDACAERPGGLVGVLVGRQDRGIPELIGARHPEMRAVVIDARAPAAELHVQLAASGPFDVLVDDFQGAAQRSATLRRCVWHLADGGSYVIRSARARRPGGADGEDGIEQVLETIEAATGGAVPDHPSRRERDDLALGRSLSVVRSAGPHVVLRKVGSSFAKLTETEANAVLAIRGGRTGRVLRTLPGTVLHTRCELEESPSSRAGQMPSSFEVPELSLRSYSDVTCAPGQVVVSGHLLLPDTYRHNQRRRLGHRFTEELGRRFARPEADLSEPDNLPGAYYYLDAEFPGHFGHTLTEQVSRLWGWREAQTAHRDLKALLSANTDRGHLADFETHLFAAAGIDTSDVELIHRPARARHLVAATPMLSNPIYVHPAIQDLWGDLGRGLRNRASGASHPRRIFCSRRQELGPGSFGGDRRTCRNGTEVEARFRAEGFEVVHPEDYPLPEQARMFEQADVIAGYAGSAMFNLMFCTGPKDVILISSESYVARNEFLISSVLGHRLRIAWCRPEIPMPADRWDPAAFLSPFTFDFTREGSFLDRVLAAL